MNSPQMEELAALHAMGLLDESGERTLLAAAETRPEVQKMMADFAECAAAMAYEAPQVEPPPELQHALLRELPARRERSKVIAFTGWLPYALAACLMGMTLYQASLIFGLDGRVKKMQAEASTLRESNRLQTLQMVSLEPKDPAYGAAKVMVAWDQATDRGVVSTQNLPSPPPGHDYQLWVLDPKAPAPLSAGLLKTAEAQRTFSVARVAAAGPGFAVSLEPSGGRPEPTGAILFAVAPGQ